MIGLLARCGPLSLLLAGFFLTAGGLVARDLRGLLVGLAVELVVWPVLIGRTGFSPMRLLPGLIALVSIAWSNWLLADPRSLEPAALAASRVAFFVLPGLVLVSYIDPFTLGDHLGQRLRLPARPVLAGVVALQQVDSFADDWDTMSRMRRARGLGPGRGPLSRVRHVVAMTLALLVEAIRRAGQMTVAMQARGYSAPVSGGRSRTWAEPAPWTGADTTLVIIGALVAAIPALVPHLPLVV